jgi:NADPH:quinone reductase
MVNTIVKAIQIDHHAGPEQLRLVDIPVGDPGPGEVRIRHKAVWLNFIDVCQRSSLYPFAMPCHALPLPLGMKASGLIDAVGDGVTHLRAGNGLPVPASRRAATAKSG